VAAIQSEMLTHHVRRRLSEQLDGCRTAGRVARQTADDLGRTIRRHAALAVAGTRDPDLLSAYLYSRAQSVMGGTSQIQKNIIASRILDWESDVYDMPAEIDVRADGALRIITLNRPDSLNSVNDDLHSGLARIWQRLTDDPTARAAVITGAGRAFSAGGDFGYLEELANDADLRAKTIRDGREIVLGMARCRIPVVAAVNGPAVGSAAAWSR